MHIASIMQFVAFAPDTRRRAVMPHEALKGLLIVAFGQAVSAPYGTSSLTDAGTRAIKDERSEGNFAHFYDKTVGEVSSHFTWINRGKESLTADLKSPADNDFSHLRGHQTSTHTTL